MSEMELGGKVKLTVPQLRVFLNAKRIVINRYEERALISTEGAGPMKFREGYAEGVKDTIEDLLRCLNLNDDWELTMDKKEDQEVTANMTTEELREYRGMVKEK